MTDADRTTGETGSDHSNLEFARTDSQLEQSTELSVFLTWYEELMGDASGEGKTNEEAANSRLAQTDSIEMSTLQETAQETAEAQQMVEVQIVEPEGDSDGFLTSDIFGHEDSQSNSGCTDISLVTVLRGESTLQKEMGVSTKGDENMEIKDVEVATRDSGDYSYFEYMRRHCKCNPEVAIVCLFVMIIVCLVLYALITLYLKMIEPEPYVIPPSSSQTDDHLSSTVATR